LFSLAGLAGVFERFATAEEAVKQLN